MPRPLFKDPLSTILLDKDKALIGARIADDGQWRFPNRGLIPFKYKLALIQFEDRDYYSHFGFNPFAFARAMWQNITSREVKSGGSTITMQLIRIMRKGKSRNVFEKMIEVTLATRLELTYTKDEILAMYAANAPFGGNVVGLEAASWRYFGRSPDRLSWAESATLAILPNSPSLIYPGKNSARLLRKRNHLLERLYEVGAMDAITLELSKAEPLPGKPFPMPSIASHMTDRAMKEGHKGQIVQTTLSSDMQQQVTDIVERHHQRLKANDINNISVIVAEVKTGNVLAYVGNTSDKDPANASYVDVNIAPRSTGSILKPFLYAAMLDDGLITPKTLVPDVPTQIGSYQPENYNLQYDGAIHASRALARSLNVPAVKMLQEFGIEKFHHLLKKLGLTTIDKPASHYGLSLILGGAEGTLWDISGVYASMARMLNMYFLRNGGVNENDWRPLNYLSEKTYEPSKQGDGTQPIFSPGSAWLTFDAMVEVARPDEDFEWQQFSSSARIAWKTGTSFGFRDGWAIGVNPQYVVAVWVGNADGEGRPGLTGVATAAPVLFDVFRILRPTGWFSQPYDNMEQVAVCRYSGFKATPVCEFVDTIWAQKNAVKVGPCPYHQIVHLDKTGMWRVNSDCESVENMQHLKWFVLPPVMEWYFKSKNPFYRALPPFRKDCETGTGNVQHMDLIYPKDLSKIYIPVELDGTPGKVVFQVAHRNEDAVIYWHLDNQFLGATTGFHQMGLQPEKGEHVLILVDTDGEQLIRKFEILGKREPLK
ncbi:MAG: penicillin-binding protein 1C [Bacteroidota bacterium]